jgi:hypothetical protein
MPTLQEQHNYKLNDYKNVSDCSKSITINPKTYSIQFKGLSYNRLNDKKNACSDFLQLLNLEQERHSKQKNVL